MYALELEGVRESKFKVEQEMVIGFLKSLRLQRILKGHICERGNLETVWK